MNQGIIEGNYVYSEIDSVEGQMYTASRLRDFMDKKEYDNAIGLFSNAEKKNIKKIKLKDDMFNYWCFAWTFDDAKYNRYITKIKEGKAHFIFEDSEWKINEK